MPTGSNGNKGKNDDFDTIPEATNESTGATSPNTIPQDKLDKYAVSKGNPPIEMAVTENDEHSNDAIDLEVSADSTAELQADYENNSKLFSPLSTTKDELNKFFSIYKDLYPDDAEADLKLLQDRKIIIDLEKTNLKPSIEAFWHHGKLKNNPNFKIVTAVDPRMCLANMPAKMYMRFRMHQVEEIKKSLEQADKICNSFLERLQLRPDPDNPDDTSKFTDGKLYKASSKRLRNKVDRIKKLISEKKSLIKQKQEELDKLKQEQATQQQAIETKLGELEALEKEIKAMEEDSDYQKLSKLSDDYFDRVEYHENAFNLYKGIELREDSAENLDYSIYHTTANKDGTTTEVQLSTMKINTNSNTLTCHIPGGLSPEMQEKAALVQMDLLTRNRERSFDLKLTISGFKRNPNMALRLFYLAAEQGSIPNIHASTIKAWEEKVKEATEEKEKLEKEDPNNTEKIERLDDIIHEYSEALEYHGKLQKAVLPYQEQVQRTLKGGARPKSLNEVIKWKYSRYKKSSAGPDVGEMAIKPRTMDELIKEKNLMKNEVEQNEAAYNQKKIKLS